jgi:hypothetical protein
MAGLILHLAGPVRLLDGAGGDWTPRGLKGRGLLALLGAAPHGRRPRAWLQDKLWSDKDQEAGAANLRQTLAELRRDLGPWRDAVVSEPGFLALDPALVTVRLEPEPGRWAIDGTVPEFAEGLDIRDPEFEDWLRDQRSALADRLERAPGAAVPTLLLAPGAAADTPPGALAAALAEDIGIALHHLSGAAVVPEAPGLLPAALTGGMRLVIRAWESGRQIVLHASLACAAGGSLTWAGRIAVPALAVAEDAGGAFGGFAARAAAAAAEGLARQRGAAEGGVAAGLRALKLLEDVSPAALEQSDRLFAAAHAASGVPILLAWRAYVAHVRGIERVGPRDRDGVALSVELARRALREDPLNPVVMAIAAEVEALSGAGLGAAAALAAAARAAAPANPFARASHAYVLSLRGDHRRAYGEALAAQRLATGYGDRFHWNMLACLTALRAGRLEAALSHAEAAATRRSKVPFRYLAPLRLALGDEGGAVDALTELRRMEPDFTLGRYEDEAYPTASLRGTPLMAIARSGLV